MPKIRRAILNGDTSLAVYPLTRANNLRTTTITVTTTAQNVFTSGFLLKRSVVILNNIGDADIKLGEDEDTQNYLLESTDSPLQLYIKDTKELWVKTAAGEATLYILEN